MTLTAVLFTGGESRRMGADKATLMVAGVPLWARQLSVLRGLSPEKIVISARTRPAWTPPEMDVVLDQPPTRGPLNGLAAALKELQTTHLLVLAVDLPQMTSEQLRKLWSLAEPGGGVIPQGGNHFEPLGAIYPVEAAAVAADALAVGELSLQSLAQILLEQRRLRIYPLSEAELPLYRNVNTPADLK